MGSCALCLPSFVATKKHVRFNDQPTVHLIRVPFIIDGITRGQKLKRAHRTHAKIRCGKALPAYSKYPASHWLVHLDHAKRAMQQDPKVLEPFKNLPPQACPSTSACPAPRKIIGDTGTAVDLIGRKRFP